MAEQPTEDGPSKPAEPDVTSTVYSHLRAIAQRKLREERPGHTLQATALVHEAYMRMERGGQNTPEIRSRFYWAAAEAMRRILIEHARARNAEKRGGGAKRETWTDGISAGAGMSAGELGDFESLDAAIVRLQEEDPRAGDVVRLRFFAGLSVEQAAEALGITARTAKRDWEYARAWLLREVRKDGAGTSGAGG